MPILGTYHVFMLVNLFIDGTCVDGAVHLVDGGTVDMGRVLYCHNGSWYSVCADDWDPSGREAQVICSTIGYETELFSKTLKT